MLPITPTIAFRSQSDFNSYNKPGLLMTELCNFTVKYYEIWNYLYCIQNYSDRHACFHCYTHNVSAIVPSECLQEYFIIFGSLLGIWNWNLYSIVGCALSSFCFSCSGNNSYPLILNSRDHVCVGSSMRTLKISILWWKKAPNVMKT